MRCGLDTSVVMRLIMGVPSDLAAKAVSEIVEVIHGGGACLVDDLVLAEAYYALQHHYKVPKAEALSALAKFSTQPGIVFSPEAMKLLRTPGLDKADPGFVDRLIHAAYEKSAVPMLTCERAAVKLANTKVITA